MSNNPNTQVSNNLSTQVSNKIIPQVSNNLCVLATTRFKSGSVMEVLENIFRESNPVFRRRCELIHLKPNKGEKFYSYMLRLIEMSEECDLHELTLEDFILLVATMHCN